MVDRHEAALPTDKLRRRRLHDARRRFITLAISDGARKDALEWITHGRRGDIMSFYNEPPWASLCAGIQKLRLVARPELRLVTPDGRPGFATVFATVGNSSEKPRQEGKLLAGTAGLEVNLGTF